MNDLETRLVEMIASIKLEPTSRANSVAITHLEEALLWYKSGKK